MVLLELCTDCEKLVAPYRGKTLRISKKTPIETVRRNRAINRDYRRGTSWRTLCAKYGVSPATIQAVVLIKNRR